MVPSYYAVMTQMMKYIEDITRWREDMNIIFEWWYCFQHEEIISISLSCRVMFFLLYA